VQLNVSSSPSPSPSSFTYNFNQTKSWPIVPIVHTASHFSLITKIKFLNELTGIEETIDYTSHFDRSAQQDLIICKKVHRVIDVQRPTGSKSHATVSTYKSNKLSAEEIPRLIKKYKTEYINYQLNIMKYNAYRHGIIKISVTDGSSVMTVQPNIDTLKKYMKDNEAKIVENNKEMEGKNYSRFSDIGIQLTNDNTNMTKCNTFLDEMIAKAENSEKEGELSNDFKTFLTNFVTQINTLSELRTDLERCIIKYNEKDTEIDTNSAVFDLYMKLNEKN
jgi:hypothetical protein